MPRAFIYTLTESDVGNSSIRLFPCSECGRPRGLVFLPIGHVQARDVGKRVYSSRGVIQVENDEQLAARNARKIGQELVAMAEEEAAEDD